MNQFVDKVLRWLRWHKVVPHIRQGDIVCDIGCGPHAAFLKNIAPTIERGIGLDKRIVEKKEGALDLRQVQIDGALPVEDASVTKATMLAVLEHLDNHLAVLRECHRILKPGGEILITVPTYYNKPLGEFLAYRLKVIEAEQYRDHKRYYNKQELRHDLEQAGFTVADTAYWEFGMNLFARAVKT